MAKDRSLDQNEMKLGFHDMKIMEDMGSGLTLILNDYFILRLMTNKLSVFKFYTKNSNQ